MMAGTSVTNCNGTGPEFADVVQPVVYDAFGREVVKYQPYAVTSNGGAYRTDGPTAANAFTKSTTGIASTDHSYAILF
ncbi:hypothetical protein CS542_07775 [Pedobacter sp. IW39]|nr:hypothetical protein CS542_07775 [Pedobacter sp. IW39]